MKSTFNPSDLKYTPEGIIPAIAQDADSGEVLMMAWMNRDSIEETLSSGRVCYWSRSRQALWRKGESSGQTQDLVTFFYDCDGDTLLLRVRQKGVACHTGRRSCFYNQVENGFVTDVLPVEIDPSKLYNKKDK